MRIQIKPDPKQGESRVIKTFIICRQIGLELRILEWSMIRQVFQEYQIDYGEYTWKWVDKEWVD